MNQHMECEERVQEEVVEDIKLFHVPLYQSAFFWFDIVFLPLFFIGFLCWQISYYRVDFHLTLPAIASFIVIFGFYLLLVRKLWLFGMDEDAFYVQHHFSNVSTRYEWSEIEKIIYEDNEWTGGLLLIQTKDGKTHKYYRQVLTDEISEALFSELQNKPITVERVLL